MVHLGVDLSFKDARERREGKDARIISDRLTDLHEEFPERVALFTHFNPQHRVSDMVLAYLDQLRAQGYAIQFISITPLPLSDSIAALRKRVSRITIRREFGRDIGAWRDVWRREAHRFSQAREVLLVNDSVLGPLCDLGPILQVMRAAPDGVIGLTDTPLIEPHLQSYFLLINGRVGVQALDAFFNQLMVTNRKTRLIRRGELGLSSFFSDRKLSVRSVFSYDEVEEALLAHPEHIRDLLTVVPDLIPDGLAWFDVGQQAEITQALRQALSQRSHNPSLIYWRVLVEELQFPFIKTELLRQSLRTGLNTEGWTEMIRLRNPDMLHHILAHLDQMLIVTE